MSNLFGCRAVMSYVTGTATYLNGATTSIYGVTAVANSVKMWWSDLSKREDKLYEFPPPPPPLNYCTSVSMTYRNKSYKSRDKSWFVSFAALFSTGSIVAAFQVSNQGDLKISFTSVTKGRDLACKTVSKEQNKMFTSKLLMADHI